METGVEDSIPVVGGPIASAGELVRVRPGASAALQGDPGYLDGGHGFFLEVEVDGRVPVVQWAGTVPTGSGAPGRGSVFRFRRAVNAARIMTIRAVPVSAAPIQIGEV